MIQEKTHFIVSRDFYESHLNVKVDYHLDNVMLRSSYVSILITKENLQEVKLRCVRAHDEIPTGDHAVHQEIFETWNRATDILWAM